jgi:hypothetical protein
MLRILGSSKRLCQGPTRRDFIHVGSMFGLGLSGLLRAQAAGSQPASTFGRAKSCILLFPYGSPPQHETFDPKPNAPAEIRSSPACRSAS